jgi:DNA topoisomerase IB
MRVRRSDCAAPGVTRRRRGRGFVYLDPAGKSVEDPSTLARIKALVIPPAWSDVWICPWPNGHIQAVGTDAAGRRQYLYHAAWREQRDVLKHERVLGLARRLPAARTRVATDLAGRGLTRQRVLAGAFRLLDLGFFRIGSETYAEANGTYGLATLRRSDVTVRGDAIVFDYNAKGSKQRVQRLIDPDLARLVRALLKRADPSDELLGWREGATWRDVRSDDVNAYVKEVVGADFSAKDFRTWNATVLMAQALAVSGQAPPSETARKRAVARAVRETADYLGNTPAVARGSYIDARVIDLYLDGVTIDPALVDDGSESPGLPTHGPVEGATARMLRSPRRAVRRG